MNAKLLHEESENILQQYARYRHYASNLERIVVEEDILNRHYCDETGNVKDHQILLQQHLLQELLQSLHDSAHKHLGISKMLQEIRQKKYYPSMAKHVKTFYSNKGRIQCFLGVCASSVQRTNESLIKRSRLNDSTRRNGTLDPRTPLRSTSCRIFPEVGDMKMSLQRSMSFQDTYLLFLLRALRQLLYLESSFTEYTE